MRLEIQTLLIDDKCFQSKEGKEQWRNWVNQYKDTLKDFNFGSLLRTDPTQDYSAENTVQTSFQFYVECLRFSVCELNSSPLKLHEIKKDTIRKSSMTQRSNQLVLLVAAVDHVKT